MPAVDELFGLDGPFFAIAGPCVIESPSMLRETAEHLAAVARRLEVPLIFKASYLKDNRTSASSFRGPGLEEGLAALVSIRDAVGLPVLSDVHTEEEARVAGGQLDVLQIPAFLCRQSRLIEAAAGTGCPLNIKKGQFLPPESARFMVEKARASGAGSVAVTERGASFGYGDLVVDPRVFQILAQVPVCSIFDATHSQQRPGGSTTGGGREFLRVVARAAVAAGARGIFFETHPDPPSARSDRDTQLPLTEAESFLTEMVETAAFVRRLTGDPS